MSSQPPLATSPASAGRRRTLAILVNSTLALLTGAFGTLLGAFALTPAVSRRDRWVRAATMTDLSAGVPVTRVLTVPRAEGWYRERARQTVFLLWDAQRGVRAMSATCTHLGCQVRWDGQDGRFHCPCHGGVYDADGRVVSGPPPRPLDAIEVRVDSNDGSVLVRV
jgi:Rieske Fe-S protein